METQKGNTECPVCNREFKISEIEGHVDRCLFLKSENKDNSKFLKRNSEVEESVYNGTSPKRKKIFPDTESRSSTSHTLDSYQKPNCSTYSESNIPLAEQMRPSTLFDYVGQEHVLGANKILRQLLEKQEIPSMILWGPPGCGKTSLAHVISKQCQKSTNQEYRFVKLSAAMSGVNDVKEAVKIAKNEANSFKRRTILFMDEIHRFNKLQQDIFLPHVENGCIILIGATTENPSFSLNSALLSRCRVIVLEKLGTQDLLKILNAALDRMSVVVKGNSKNTVNGDDNSRFCMDEESVQWLAEMCDGDARIGLNSLQMTLNAHANTTGSVHITLDDIKDGIKRSHLLYDRKGDEHYNIISALHKSIRASDENAAMYWLTRMIEGGEDPMYIARRLLVCASEDVGLEDPIAMTMAVSAMQACHLVGMPECGLFLAQITTYLARAPKSREVYNALTAAKSCIAEHRGPLPSVPLHLRNAPRKLMRDIGYGAGYNMKNKDESNLTYMPEGMENVKFFK